MAFAWTDLRPTSNPTVWESQEVADPELTGPDKLCNVFGSIIGDFSGGGNPNTDTYSWKIFSPSGQLLFERSGGFQTISYTFSLIGTHRVELTVSRGNPIIYNEVKEVELIRGPQVILQSNYQLCGSSTVELTAISPSTTNFSDYLFEWKNEQGTILGTTNTIQVDSPGIYDVKFYFEDILGTSVCLSELSTSVEGVNDYQITQSANDACPDLQVTFATDPQVSGSWFYEKNGTGTRNYLADGNTINIFPNQNLNGEGNYSIIFIPDSSTGACLVEKSTTLTYFPQPDFFLVSSVGASGCKVYDGALTIQATTPLDYIFIEGIGVVSPPLSPGDTFEFTNLESGAYSMVGVLGSCINTLGSVVSLTDPPESLKFSITDIQGEMCTEDGKTLGSFDVLFTNGPFDGSYRVINEKGAEVQSSLLESTSGLNIEIPGGRYYFELYSTDSCSLPKAELIDVPGLGLTEFYVPDELTICQSFDLIPSTSQDLVFKLEYPDKTIITKNTDEAFEINAAGTYKLIGSHSSDPLICPTAKEFEVFVVEPVDYEPVLINQDCFGNRTYFAEINGRDPSSVIFSWYNENDELIGTGQSMFPTSIGEFKLDVQPANSQACQNPPKVFLIEEPILEVDLSILSTKLCEFGPEAIVSLESTFPEEITHIRWRRFDSNGDIIELPEFNELWEITTRTGGTYEASVYSIIPAINKNCELGRATFQLDLTPDKVLFDIPEKITICESYELTPETSDNLDFFVTAPDGSVEEGVTGQSFTLDQVGTYTFLAFDQDSPTPFCPEQKEIIVQTTEPVIFEPVLFEALCDGTRTYQAQIQNYPVEEVTISWMDQEGAIIGTDEFLTLPGPGAYSLLVQPVNSTPCPYPPVEFIQEPPVFSVDISLTADPLCPDAESAILTASADMETFTRLEWWFTDLEGNQSQLNQFTNQLEILALQEGTYEVRALDEIPCLLGTDQVLLLRSQDTVRPEVEESYQVCPKYSIGPTIDPGNFASYEWYYQEQLVSTSPTFKPLQVGSYQLIVYSLEGCAYQATFVTEEECELKVIFPTAMTPGDSDKPFLIYTNYLVDELELWIFNQWGELIFHCQNNSLISEESTCPWDGYLNGDKIPNGAYTLRVNYRNIEKNIRQEYLGSIMVID